MKEIILSNGTVLQTRQVPPYAYGVVHKRVQEPKYPQVTLRSSTGSVEEAPALKDSPEWEEYRLKYAAYRKALGKAVIDFALAYGVLRWHSSDSKTFKTEPHKGWSIDTTLKAYGIVEETDPLMRRVQYIKYVLLETDSDVNAVEAAIGVRDEVSSEDVKEALVPFDSGGS